MSELQKLLAKVQLELKAPKSQRNNFGNYNYRSCEDILAAVKPLIDGKAVLTLEDDIILVGDRFYVKATATFRLGEESLQTSAFAREPENKKGMDSAQVTGATSSYARKYALNGLFAIDDVKDADTMDNSLQTTKKEDDNKEWLNLDSNVKAKDGITKMYSEGKSSKEILTLLRTKYKISKATAKSIEDKKYV